MTNSIRAIAALLLLSCGAEEEATYIDVDARRELIRLSVDLRGVHPSEAELLAIEGDPDLYEEFVDRFLEDPRYIDQMMAIFNLRYLTRTGDAYSLDTRVEEAPRRDVANAIGDESLMLLRQILEQDLPYREIVLADYTMTNGLLADVFDITYDWGSSGWMQGQYKDGRPHAGILTMTSFWLRYDSADGNANRHRANAVSRALLCDDFLSRPIVLNRAAVDQLIQDPESAINSNDGCQACHSTLDPLASHFFGFFGTESSPMLYMPENEEGWREYSGRPAGYFGRPTANIYEMANYIAEDSRFIDCAVQTVFEGLTQRTTSENSWSEFQDHRSAFVASDQQIRALVRSIVMSSEYRAVKANNDVQDGELATVKLASPAQLASIIEDITGYRWSFTGEDGLTSQNKGIPVLLGGVDSLTITTRNFNPSVGGVLVQERLAQSASWAVVEADFDPERTGEARLLKYVTIDTRPDTEEGYAAFDAQIRHLYKRITGYPLVDDATEPDELIQLWRQVLSVEGSSSTAWAAIVGAVLRDPLVLLY